MEDKHKPKNFVYVIRVFDLTGDNELNYTLQEVYTSRSEAQKRVADEVRHYLSTSNVLNLTEKDVTGNTNFEEVIIQNKDDTYTIVHLEVLEHKLYNTFDESVKDIETKRIIYG